MSHDFVGLIKYAFVSLEIKSLHFDNLAALSRAVGSYYPHARSRTTFTFTVRQRAQPHHPPKRTGYMLDGGKIQLDGDPGY